MEKQQDLAPIQTNTKRRGSIPLQLSQGPPVDLYHGGLSILTIGDGDFSFSLSIARWLTFKYPDNPGVITATSYDRREELEQMYKHTIVPTIKALEKMPNTKILYEVDVNKLEEYQEKLAFALKIEGNDKKAPQEKGDSQYDRVIWNFPHAGFPEEQKNEHKGPGFEWEADFHERHVSLIEKFFQKSRLYLRKDGLAVMTHKTVNPFGLWNIPKIGVQNGFELVQELQFDIDRYPGYENRRGAGKCGGKKFPCEDAKTYVFRQKPTQ